MFTLACHHVLFVVVLPHVTLPVVFGCLFSSQITFVYFDPCRVFFVVFWLFLAAFASFCPFRSAAPIDPPKSFGLQQRIFAVMSTAASMCDIQHVLRLNGFGNLQAALYAPGADTFIARLRRTPNSVKLTFRARVRDPPELLYAVQDIRTALWRLLVRAFGQPAAGGWSLAAFDAYEDVSASIVAFSGLGLDRMVQGVQEHFMPADDRGFLITFRYDIPSLSGSHQTYHIDRPRRAVAHF